MDTAAIITSVLTLIAGVGIFLIACSTMSSNLEALGSKKLKSLFSKASKSKLLGVGVGAATTAVIQSSSATSVMVIGFVNAGIMTLAQAATVIFGANIGTTITGSDSRPRTVRRQFRFHFGNFRRACGSGRFYTCLCQKG